MKRGQEYQYRRVWGGGGEGMERYFKLEKVWPINKVSALFLQDLPVLREVDYCLAGSRNPFLMAPLCRRQSIQNFCYSIRIS
jgi:hypothetical protein